MIHNDLAAILNKILGLHIPSIGTATLERSINRRLKSLNLASQEEYVLLLRKNNAEVKHLIDEVVISETWFFRDAEPFAALREILLKRLSSAPSSRIRILSIPCATGEEPYSIVMTLLDAGWQKDMFSVDAVDISANAIEKAKQAMYTKNSFRSSDLNFRDKYFNPKGAAYELKKEITRKVRFFCGNILDPNFMGILGRYDVIFCRNILIYLDYEAQRRTIATLGHLLSPKGLLFVGAAEANIYLSYGFTPKDGRFSFALVLSPRKKDLFKKAGDWEAKEEAKKAPFAKKISPPAKKPEQNKPPQPEPTDSEQIETLALARKLADQGDLVEATKCCEEILEKYGPSAEIYNLLGTINNFSGNADLAVKLLKKALYLEPDHEESLVLLCYLSEKIGDNKAVTNYKRRLRRIDQRQK